MRRWIGSVVGAGTLLAIALGFVRWPVSSEWTSRWLADSGLKIAISGLGGSDFALLPWPMLHLRDLSIETAPDALRVSAPTADVHIDPVRLAAGSVIVSGLTLRHPRAEIDADRLRLWSNDIATGDWPWQGRVDVVDGQARLTGAAQDLEGDFVELNGALEWRKSADSVRVWLAGKTRGVPISLDALVDGRRALKQGHSATSTVRLRMPGFDLDFNGTWRQAEEPKFEGDLKTNIRSPAILTAILGFDPGWTQPVSASGRVKASPSGFGLANAELTLAGQAFEGSLSLNRAATRPALSATVDAPTLDLGALFGALPSLTNADGAWSAEPRLPQPTQAADIDLRISAGKAHWGAHVLTDTAFAVLQKDALLTIKLLDVGAYGGMVSGEVDIRGGPTPGTQISGSLVNADVGAALADWGAPGFTGHGKATLSLAAQGLSPAEIAASAKGDLTVELGAGAIDGFNLEEGLRRSQRHQVEITRDLLVGQTRFLSARADGKFEDGRLTLHNGRTDGPGAAMVLTGTGDVVGRTWDLRMDASQTGSDGAEGPTAPHLIVRMTGPWGAPNLSVFAAPN